MGFINRLGLLWYLQESNQGHKDFQSFALPTELRYRIEKDAVFEASFYLLRVQR